MPEVKTLQDNDRFCDLLQDMLAEHLVVRVALAYRLILFVGDSAAGCWVDRDTTPFDGRQDGSIYE
jgi:hypothetical protein